MTENAMNMTPFSSVLIANRGEIACRIMRTARAMGLRCIAVHTRADADSPHVAMADQAVCIGEGPVGDSYLSVTRILEAARETGAEAIHPGYGFLSESAEFAKVCGEAGLVFIGPGADAIALMGNKAAAKRRMIDAGVPCVPGYEGADQSEAVLVQEAARIGYPVMIKAAAGGGGRGMRLVENADGFADALALARSEALSAFGSDEVILEKAILQPRHVEIQVFADRSGETLHLGERDCSVQRRHQKVVEEAPSPAVSPDLRARMGQAAISAARAVGYEGAGTVEFLLDDQGVFYFLEMNTRLQVEHPVTELVTGLDLVAMQLRVARGEALGLSQDDLQLNGHAVEVRLYAEDPDQDFLPQAGTVQDWVPPTGPGVRVDGGVKAGQQISPWYDPMLAKIIAHGATREEARQRLITALGQTVLTGLAHNRDFLMRVLSHPEFANGSATTGFLAAHPEALASPALSAVEKAMTAALRYFAGRDAFAGQVADELLGWSSTGRLRHSLKLKANGEDILCEVTEAAGEVTVHLDGDELACCLTGQGMRVAGQLIRISSCVFRAGGLQVVTDQRCITVETVVPGVSEGSAAQSGQVTAPMHGNLLEILVRVGDTVEAGARLAVLEAMKMQHEILAPVGGVVAELPVSPGVQVRAGDLLIGIDPQA
jgi:geranyl-CoA carboxylase alpha subunit